MNAQNRTKELGPDSKSTLKAATDVAICLGLQFRADEAEKLYLATLERQVKFVGTHSRDTYITRGAIAGIYVFKRNWCAAEIVLHQQIEILEEVAGPFHKNTLDRKSFLGSVISMGYRFNKTETNVSNIFLVSLRIQITSDTLSTWYFLLLNFALPLFILD